MLQERAVRKRTRAIKSLCIPLKGNTEPMFYLCILSRFGNHEANSYGLGLYVYGLKPAGELQPIVADSQNQQVNACILALRSDFSRKSTSVLPV